MNRLLRTTLGIGVFFAAGTIFAAADSDVDRLYKVLRTGDTSGLKSLLEHGVSAKTSDDRQITPLMYAAELSSADAMRILIEHGADVNAQNAFGSTALMWAGADATKVRLLLDHGADVNKAAKSGRTALMIASLSSPSAEVVKMLLTKSADPLMADQFGFTALLAAALGNDTASIHMLVDAGADVNRSGNLGPNGLKGVTPLMLAAGNRNLEACRLLLAKGAQVNVRSDDKNLSKVKNGWSPEGASLRC